MKNPENFNKIEEEDYEDRCSVEVLDEEKSSWDKIGTEILRVEQSAAEQDKWLSEEILQNVFETPGSIKVVLKDEVQDRIVGFSVAGPAKTFYFEDFPERQTDDETAYIYDTALEKEYQGKGLVTSLIDALEQKMIEQGFRFMERDAENNAKDEEGETYADKIRKNYRDRIVKEEEHDSPYGSQVLFRIKLEKEHQQNAEEGEVKEKK